MSFDLFLFQTIHNLAGQSKIFDWLIIFFADYLGYFLLIGVLVFIIGKKSFIQRFYYFAFISLSLILSRGLITEIIRFFYDRPRPFEVLNFIPLVNHISASFPSGHAAVYFALAFAIFWLNRKWGWWYLAAAFLMGLARVAGGAHWPMDILGGIIVGLLSVFAVYFILNRTLKYERENP